MRLAKLKAELQDLVNHDEDQVLFVSLGPSAGDATLAIEAMGLPYEVRSRVIGRVRPPPQLLSN